VDDAGIGSKLEQLAAGLNAKLDSLGQVAARGGSTPATARQVQEVAVQFDSLFARDLENELESNINDIDVKNREGKGIGSNLERIKQLRAGGGTEKRVNEDN
jgi:hypothetical protein